MTTPQGAGTEPAPSRLMHLRLSCSRCRLWLVHTLARKEQGGPRPQHRCIVDGRARPFDREEEIESRPSDVRGYERKP